MSARVPVKVWLDGPVFVALERIGQAKDSTVGELLERLAVTALTKPQRRRGQRGHYLKMTDELLEQIHQRRAEGQTLHEISSSLGVAASTVHAHVTRRRSGSSEDAS